MNNTKFFILVSLIALLLYFGMGFFKPVIFDNKETKRKIDSLNNVILNMKQEQVKLDSIINNFNNEIDSVDNKVKNIKGQKTIIREIYHEKINNVNSYDSKQIDSFFSDRYGTY